MATLITFVTPNLQKLSRIDGNLCIPRACSVDKALCALRQSRKRGGGEGEYAQFHDRSVGRGNKKNYGRAHIGDVLNIKHLYDSVRFGKRYR